MTLAKLENALLFLVLLFLPTQLGKHFWPNFSYIYSLKIDYLSPTFYFWDVLVVSLLVIWAIRRSEVNKLALNLFFLFLLTQALSLMGAQNLGAGLVRLEQYMVAGLFGLYISSQDIKSLGRIIYLPLSLGILGQSLLAILQFIKGGTLGLWILGERNFTISTPGIAKFDFYGWQFLRPYATFPHPNVLAGFMLVGASILYQLSRGRKKYVAFVQLFASASVFLTMSRVAILAGLGMLLIILKRKWLVLVVILILVVSPVLLTRFFSVFNFDNLAYIRREELIVEAWQLFFKNPYFGIGLNNFILALADNLTAGPSRFLQPVHNIFFLSLTETGLVGLAGFLLLIGYPIRQMLKRKILIINLLPLLLIIFLGMFDHYFLTLPQGYRMLFLVWGLSLSMLK